MLQVHIYFQIEHLQVSVLIQVFFSIQRWGGCAATIIPSPGDHVWGVLWQLEMKHLETLDDQEGVHKQIYERINVQVEVPDQTEPVSVYSYQVRKEKLHPLGEDCIPSKAYKSVILEGAHENNLPKEYIKK